MNLDRFQASPTNDGYSSYYDKLDCDNINYCKQCDKEFIMYQGYNGDDKFCCPDCYEDYIDNLFQKMEEDNND